MNDTTDAISAIPSLLVFDGGIGSWPIAYGLSKVGFIVTHLAHLQKFPFGQMGKKELENMVYEIAIYANKLGFDGLVIASNTPTIAVYDEVVKKVKQANIFLPIFGVKPPIREAFEELKIRKKPQKLCVLGTRGMVNSKKIKQYLKICTPIGSKVVLEDSSFIIENYIEKNTSSSEKLDAIHCFLELIENKHGNISAYTLSSTHLPTLKKYFEEVSPDVLFFDPAASVINSISDYFNARGLNKLHPEGVIKSVYTQPTSNISIDNYNTRLNMLAGKSISIEVATLFRTDYNEIV